MNARNTSPKMRLAAILFSIVTFGASSQALALSAETPAMTPHTLTQDEIHFLMGDRAPQTHPASLVYLGRQEMSETEGKAIPGPTGGITGGIAGGFAYVGYITTSGKQFTMSELLGAVAMGGAIGFVTGGAGTLAEALFHNQVAFYGGMIGGGVDAAVRRFQECSNMSVMDEMYERYC